ncbi:hypothetical protein CLAFUW4_06965 [Fulvia fulva]|uniref:Aminoglycoside phosphotransferase domain-containing protein n=1 Tax=Passalora fulva TaxID=5499 RepID=A0A9Q8PA63_PASFU|nr:uncharacterized protein CLAFUR5_07101 [Fulvia fulva]KAK4621530.1 hypothetical protein CLAFUR4_06974 [Fulvia fulva]KAK4622478.1 hypothetical protein CLAFUR0_06972 [Fulvia fulva]UJO18723.1 hypothetical protein CLAFUR5_07101 [Fulvia fulva]WPV16198.1 hypothetical protein CLAFUW4_06965 [Fulvia fulva]WPV30933.1 hypothetical protein CLAFUW7_06965 [Fulvia fulva]
MAGITFDHADLPIGDVYLPGHFPHGLPSPAEVRVKAAQDGIDTRNTFRPDPVLYPELGLIIKWGRDITIAEGQCLWFMSKHLRGVVPVPELYGWTVDSDQTFLYMQLVNADTLQGRWNDMSEDDKLDICAQLRDMMAAWRRIQCPGPTSNDSRPRTILSTVMSWLRFWRPAPAIRLGQICGQALRDILFYNAGQYPAGPFDNVHSFHDWLAKLACANDARKDVEELSGLEDSVAVTFTHGDLDHSNILISKKPDGPPKIVAIIDWHQSGWYPEPWEWLKAQMVAGHSSQWTKEYLPRTLRPARYEYHYSWEYIKMATI